MEHIETFKDKIAIVGLDCRLPGANNVQEFWKILLDEREALTEFTDEELKSSGVLPKVYNSPNYVRRRGIIQDPEKFDAEFFNFNPREAELLDPQQRVFLECAWHALEDAGIDPYNSDKKIAVFGGTGSPYQLVDAIENRDKLKYADGTQIITSNDKDYVTTRVSYKLNLNGPSVNVQCACSTSMVAVVMGVDSLLSYQSDVVLAGGATIEVPAHKGYLYQVGGLESPDGRCKTFDKDAQGTVFSRGCGVIALKRLADAIQDGDHIYSVILGGAINNDGNRKAGYTAPSIQGQVEVITEAIELAGIDPKTIGMVEAHGTSTPVGDPIEVASLTEAFKQYVDENQFCAIGSVKTNIGHTDVASGVASLIKVCLSLENGIIPASLNFNEHNPAINFEESPFYVNTKTVSWPQKDQPRRALINSFGVGGTNACVILEEPPGINQENLSHNYDLLVVSAHNKQSYEDYTRNIREFLVERPEVNLNALAHTSRVGRKAMKYKGVFAFKDLSDLMAKLEKSAPLTNTTEAQKELVWMFPGQGNQFVNMGRELYENFPPFKETIDYCADILTPLLKLDIREIIYPKPDKERIAAELIDRTYITQPAIFMVSYAIARLYNRFGLLPDALIGHSVGEYVAATVAGVMSLEDALKAVARRGQLVYDSPQGSMLAVMLNEEKLLEILPDSLDIAVINSPELVVVSGSTDAIESFASYLEQQNIFNKILPTSHAFHSRMMLPCLDSYREFFKNIALKEPQIPIISTVTGKVLKGQEATDHEYWVQHVLDPVRFAEAVSVKLSDDSAVFLECGPGHSLESSIKRRLQPDDKFVTVGTLYEGQDAVISLDNSIGKLWIENIYIDFDARFATKGMQKISYPLLPFNRRSFLIDFKALRGEENITENLKRENLSDWFSVPSWKKTAPVQLVPKNEKEIVVLPEKWIVFVNDNNGKRIVEFLQNQNEDVYKIEIGDSFHRTNNNFTIQISNAEHYQKLFSQIDAEGYLIRIIHAWNLEGEDEESLNLKNVDFKLDLAFYSPIYVEQGLIKNNLTDHISLTCLINDGFNVTGFTKVRPEKSLAVGPVRVIFKEHPGVVSRLINLEGLSENFSDYLIEQIVLETTVETNDNLISYFNKSRWVESFEEIELFKNRDAKSQQLKENGVYLITGGGGGIGRTFSTLIADTVRATVIWTGRKALPAREEWDLLIEDDRTDVNLRDKLKTIRHIEAMGSTFDYFSVEADDLPGMQRVLASIEEKHGQLNGLIHSAGVAGGGVIALKDKVEADRVIKPKVQGVLILKELLKGRAVDFVHLFSSITALLGEAGRVDYTAANSFLDAVSNGDFLELDTDVLSVNWGQWGLIGMAADWQREKARRKQKPHNEKPVYGNPESIAIKLVESEILPNNSYFQVDVNPEQHWVMNEHILSGIPTLVGTSYLSILTQWKSKLGLDGDLVVNEAEFVSPLMIFNRNQQILNLHIQVLDDNRYEFVFGSGSDLNSNNESGWKIHFRGQCTIRPSIPIPGIDLPDLQKSVAQEADLMPHFLAVRDANDKILLQYSDRWNCKKGIYVGHNEWLTKLILEPKYLDDLGHYDIHPALLDVATSAHFPHFAASGGSYLPFAYGEVQFLQPMEQEIYCYTKKVEHDRDQDKYVAFDFSIYNKEGLLLICLKKYLFVKVSEASEASRKANTVVENFKVDVHDDDILPEEGREVLEILLQYGGLKQIIVFTKDFQKEFDETKIICIRKELSKKKKALEVAVQEIDDRPDIDTVYEAPENEIEKGIAAVWTGILGISKIGVNDSFNELGGNSLLAIQVISGIGDEFGVEIQANEFVAYPTVRALSELVLVKILESQEEIDIESILNEETV